MKLPDVPDDQSVLVRPRFAVRPDGSAGGVELRQAAGVDDMRFQATAGHSPYYDDEPFGC